MKILNKIFSKYVQKEEPENVLMISKIIGPIIDKKANDIFMYYREKLLTEPITYIVPAVWGAKEGGELTVAQKEMNSRIAPVIAEIFDAFQLKDLRGAQEYAIGFLIRGLFISKITYMIETLRSLINDKDTIYKNPTDYQSIDLENIEPVGNA